MLSLFWRIFNSGLKGVSWMVGWWRGVTRTKFLPDTQALRFHIEFSCEIVRQCLAFATFVCITIIINNR